MKIKFKKEEKIYNVMGGQSRRLPTVILKKILSNYILECFFYIFPYFCVYHLLARVHYKYTNEKHEKKKKTLTICVFSFSIFLDSL